MSILACPKCHEPLEIEGKTCKCINNHCYDIARQGYMNLLLNPDKASNNPGDSKESLIARKAYLDKGYYDPILFFLVNEKTITTIVVAVNIGLIILSAITALDPLVIILELCALKEEKPPAKIYLIAEPI